MEQQIGSKLGKECIKAVYCYPIYLTYTQEFSSAQLSHSIVSDSATSWTAACQTSLSITNSQNLPKHMSIESVMLSNHLTLCRSLLLLPSVFPNIRGFSNESSLRIRWPKYWSFSFNISPSNEHAGLISFRNGLVGSPCSPRDSQESSPTPQFKSINSLALRFLYSPLSHPYMTTGKTTVLTSRTFVDKVMSLLFNMLSRLVIEYNMWNAGLDESQAGIKLPGEI